MREPDAVLRELSKQSVKDCYKFKRLYRILYNPGMYELAFQNIYVNKGAVTPGVSNTTISGFGKDRIYKLIASIKDRSYNPHPVRRTYITKKDGKSKRPLGITEGNDKIVQEIVKMVLEAIYVPNFSEWSHGFRKDRSCHTALQQVKEQFRGVNWFIEGDIHACFDSFDHHILIQILKKKIEDETFIELIWKFLKAGYLEQWIYTDSYSGVPQGSGCSPVLCNIYLNELDSFIATYKNKFDSKIIKYSANPEYSKLMNKAHRVKPEIWANMDPTEKRIKLKDIKKLKGQARKLNPVIKKNTGIRQIVYVRYADDFLIGVIGGKADAIEIRKSVKDFLEITLHLELSMDKTKITHGTDRAKFLGYDISICRDNNCSKSKTGRMQRTYNGAVKLYMPPNTVRDKLLKYSAIEINTANGGIEVWRPLPRKEVAFRTPLDIVSTYNAEIRGLYNYYAMACNVCRLAGFRSLMKRSCMKTLGTKFRCNCKAIMEKYGKEGNIVVEYHKKDGSTAKVEFHHDGFHKVDKPLRRVADAMPIRNWRKEITRRYERGICELCGKTTSSIQVYLVKKLKDLSNKWLWEIRMKGMRRKSLMTCPECYLAIKTGTSLPAEI